MRQDLDFWIAALQYTPDLEIPTLQTATALKELIIRLDTELVELDFSMLIEHLGRIEKTFTGIRPSERAGL